MGQMIRSRKTIWAFCKDPGGANAVVPVVKYLRRLGHRVDFYCDGRPARKILELAGISYIVYSSARAIINRPERPSLIITSMNSGGGLGYETAKLLRKEKCFYPLVLISDFWGLRDIDTKIEVRPDYVCVSDRIGREVALKTWPKLGRDRVFITGYPALDKYKNFKTAAVAKKTRARLKIDSDLPTVLFCGQLNYSGRALRELMKALGELDQRVNLIARPHPRMRRDAAKEWKIWQKTLGDFRSGKLINGARYKI